MTILQITKENNDKYKALPCKRCKARKKEDVFPKIVVVDDLYYAQCPCCTYYDQYDFLSTSTKGAVKVWNETMSRKNDFIK